MALNFFRTYKNKRFTYHPLYYNQQKEELQERIKRIEGEQKGISDENYTPGIIKGSFRHSRLVRSQANRNSSIRVIVIAVILLALVYYIFRM
ncbi:MAG: hypothetical protein PVF73_02955 [Bacteroidales bacterium]|jgi:hypothetical protein